MTRPSTPRRSALVLALGALLAPLLAGCNSGKPQFKNTDITGADYAKGFALTDHTGKPRTLADYQGKVVSIFFGFTFCPDACPGALAEMREVMEKLGPAAKEVQVLFVTVDPERDTQELLSKYVPAFHPSFIGLRGSVAEVTKAAKDFKVFFAKVPGKTPGSYTVDHTTGSYVFDQQGRVRLFVRHGQPVEGLLGDIKLLLAQK